MPAPLAKGIIITLTLLTALGGALLANPQVRAWVEEQRRKIAEALRSLGDELDPQSRRQAEAFAYEGRIPGDRVEPSGVPPALARRESEAARRAVARATGRDTGIDLDETSRRLNRTGSGSLIDSATGKLGEDEEAERRRLGREYLAKRNAEMLEAKEKAKMKKSAASLTPAEASCPAVEEKNHASSSVKTPDARPIHVSDQPNPWTFDNLVDENGSLKSPVEEQDMDRTLELPSPPTTEPTSFGKRRIPIAEEVKSEPEISYPVIQPSGFDTGSRWANPFGDEFELDESGSGYETPKAASQAPPLPPKIALDQDPEISVPDLQQLGRENQPDTTRQEDISEQIQVGSTADQTRHDNTQNVNTVDHDLQFDEELARALSLSMTDEEEKQRKILENIVRNEEAELAAAIAASLAEPEQQHRNILNAQAMVQRRNEAARERLQRKLSAGMAKKDAKLAAAHEKIAENTTQTSRWEDPVQMQTLVDISPESDPPVSIPHTPGAASRQSVAAVDDSDSEGLYYASPEVQASRPASLSSPFTFPPSSTPYYNKVQEAASAGSSSTPAKPPPYDNTVRGRQDILIDIDDSTEEEVHPINLFQDAAKRQKLGLTRSQGSSSAVQAEDVDQGLSNRISWMESDEFAAMLKSSRNREDKDEQQELERAQVKGAKGTQTPTTATTSPSVERESIAFSSGDEDDFVSAADSVAHSTRAINAASPTASFTTDAAPTEHESSDTDSLVGHSEAESASLIDVDEEREHTEVVEDDDSSDDEWESGVRTPGSEWTDVGSVVSEEEVGGQDSRRLA